MYSLILPSWLFRVAWLYYQVLIATLARFSIKGWGNLLVDLTFLTFSSCMTVLPSSHCNTCTFLYKRLGECSRWSYLLDCFELLVELFGQLCVLLSQLSHGGLVRLRAFLYVLLQRYQLGFSLLAHFRHRRGGIDRLFQLRFEVF